MKINFNPYFASLALAASLTFFTACNKDVEEAVPATAPSPTPAAPGAPTVADQIKADAGLSILSAAVTRASTSAASPSLATLLADRTAEYTFFAPTDAAFATIGITSTAGLNNYRPGQLDTILRYHIVSGRVPAAAIPSTFPNAQLPTQFVLQQPSATLPPGLRASVFASKRGTNAWINNIPVIQTDITAPNGLIHKIASVLIPPSQFLWDRINTDPNLTFLKAAIQRADSGSTTATSLVAALQNPAANLTVFAPVDTAFRSAITGLIAQGLIAQGVPAPTALAQATALAATPAVFSNPLLYSSINAQTVKGVVVYHLLGTRAFTVNLSPVGSATPTLLNAAVPTHPGLTHMATFGATGVTSAFVRGIANTSVSNLFINPTPAPGGTSDQHYINGVLHLINQVLRPQ